MPAARLTAVFWKARSARIAYFVSGADRQFGAAYEIPDEAIEEVGVATMKR